MVCMRGHVHTTAPYAACYPPPVPAWSLATSAARPHRFTVVELLDGDLVDVSPQGPEHAWAGARVLAAVASAYRGSCQIRSQSPLELGQRSRPEPDVAVVRGGPDAFKHAHPSGRDAVLVVEVAFGSQAIDRDKARLYAEGGAPVHWLLDVEARTLAVHGDPTPQGYRTVATLDERLEVELPIVGTRLRVRDLLP